MEENGQTRLYPGAALGGVGLYRDLEKWPQRDRRRGDRLDHIHFDGLGPYTGQHLQQALDVLEKLDKDHYSTLRISDASRQRGIDLYRDALDLILAHLLVQRLTSHTWTSLEELRTALQPAVPAACSRWADLAGLYAPLELLEDLLQDIEDGHIKELTQLQECLVSLHEQYPAWRWDWAVNLWEGRLGNSLETLTAQDLIEALERGQQAQARLHRMQYQDVQRDFGNEARIGYGLDGDPDACARDFEAVRGVVPEAIPYRQEDFSDWIKKIRRLDRE